MKHYTQRSQNDKMRGQLRGRQGLEMGRGTIRGAGVTRRMQLGDPPGDGMVLHLGRGGGYMNVSRGQNCTEPSTRNSALLRTAASTPSSYVDA